MHDKLYHNQVVPDFCRHNNIYWVIHNLKQNKTHSCWLRQKLNVRAVYTEQNDYVCILSEFFRVCLEFFQRLEFGPFLHLL